VVKFNGGASNRFSAALTAACLAAALAGCGDANLGGKTALEQADEAARIARSAGDYRPKESFLSDIAGKSPDEAKSAADSVAAKINADPNAWKSYFDRNSRADDLKAAVTQLNAAASANVPPAIQQVVASELGTVTGEEAGELLSQVQAKVLDLSRRSVALQDQASTVIALAGQADVQDSRSKAQATDTAAAQGELATAKAAVEKAQGTVDDLNKQITDRRTRAGDIYAQAEQAYQAGENLKGNAAVEAGRKTMEARKEGDKLIAEAATLGLQLTQAQADLTLAKIRQTEAENKLKILQSGIESQQKQAQGASSLASTYRDLAKKLLDAQEGLRQQQKDFAQLGDQIDKQIKDAVATCAAADKAYGTALTALDENQRKLAEIPNQEDSPLASAAHDNRAKSLLQLQQAAARLQTGQANLMAAQVAAMRASAETAIAMAQDASAGKPRTTPPASAPSEAGASAVTAAGKEFKSSFDLAGTAMNAAKSAPPVQWLALSLQANARYGQGIAENNPALRDEAQTLARQALDLNPYLPLAALAGAAASAPAGAPAPAQGAPAPAAAPTAPAAPGNPATPAPPAPPVE
jgi:hypothetical protein